MLLSRERVLSVCWGTLLGLTSSGVMAASSGFPALRILKSLVESEGAFDEQQDFSEGFHDLVWDPQVFPEAQRSWIYFHVPEPALQRLMENLDENGQALLR